MQIYRRVKVEINPIEFGRLLRELRKKDGRNVQTLATCAGMSQKYWYDLEKGVAGSLDEQKLRGIEQVLNHDFGVIFDGNN